MNTIIDTIESTEHSVAEAFRIIADGVCPDGFQLADERESLLWGFVNMLHAQTQRIDRGGDKLTPELRDLQREQGGSEIKSRELELVTDRAQNLGDRRDAFETLRAAADARDFLRARKDRKTAAHLPKGVITFPGSGITENLVDKARQLGIPVMRCCA